VPSSALPPTAVALGVCLLLGCAAVAASRGFASSPRAVAPSAATARRSLVSSSVTGNRLAVGVAAGFLVLLATRWLMLSLLVAAMVLSWNRLLHDARGDDERRRIEGIAKWLEDLRDTLRGSAMGAEEALEQVALRPPAVIAKPLQHYAQHRRQGYRTEDALADLADELAHPSADAAIAAICLVIGGSTGAGRLYGTVNSLAAAARHEVAARERIDRTRAVYQSSMKRLVVIGALLVAYLRFAAGDLLDPYNTATGQVVLLLPLGLWLGCVLWLRSLCRYEAPGRYRVAGSGASR
jgi:tight adherence protein B